MVEILNYVCWIGADTPVSCGSRGYMSPGLGLRQSYTPEVYDVPRL